MKILQFLSKLILDNKLLRFHKKITLNKSVNSHKQIYQGSKFHHPEFSVSAKVPMRPHRVHFALKTSRTFNWKLIQYQSSQHPEGTIRKRKRH